MAFCMHGPQPEELHGMYGCNYWHGMGALIGMTNELSAWLCKLGTNNDLMT